MLMMLILFVGDSVVGVVGDVDNAHGVGGVVELFVVVVAVAAAVVVVVVVVSGVVFVSDAVVAASCRGGVQWSFVGGTLQHSSSYIFDGGSDFISYSNIDTHIYIYIYTNPHACLEREKGTHVPIYACMCVVD